MLYKYTDKKKKSYFCILRSGNVYQSLGRRVYNIQKLQNCGSIIRNSGFTCKITSCKSQHEKAEHHVNTLLWSLPVYVFLNKQHIYRNSDLPLLSTTSLSMPRGPRVVRTASATTWQALMLLTSCGIPWEVSVPSFRRMTGVGWGEMFKNHYNIITTASFEFN